MKIDLSRNIFRFPRGELPEHFKLAAVLVVLRFTEKGLQVVLTKRSEKLRDHPGEISFPGGKLEPGETLLQAAVREAEEEIGLTIMPENIIGSLDDAWSRGGYHITSVVAVIDALPSFELSEEVERIVIFDDTSDYRVDYIQRDMKNYHFADPVITIGEEKIIGATADLILEVLDALKGEYCDRGAMRLKLLRSVFPSTLG